MKINTNMLYGWVKRYSGESEIVATQALLRERPTVFREEVHRFFFPKMTRRVEQVVICYQVSWGDVTGLLSP
jgi:hypothetical protein